MSATRCRARRDGQDARFAPNGRSRKHILKCRSRLQPAYPPSPAGVGVVTFLCTLSFSKKESVSPGAGFGPIPAEKEKHDRMVSLVDRMLDLHKKKADAKSPTDVDRIERMIASTDDEIDRLVYELYGLTEEEIGIVEGKG